MSAAPKPDRNPYYREYMKKRRMAQQPLYIEDIDLVTRKLLDDYHKQSGLSLKAIVNDALLAYLTPKVK